MSDATLVQVPLWGGLDESIDDARVPQTRMRRADNVIFPSTGVLAKRNGFTVISSALNTLDGGGTLTNVKRLIAHKNQLLSTDPIYLNAYTPSTTKHARAGRIPAVVGSRQEFTSSTASVGDIADCGNYRAIVWTVLTGVGAGNYVSIIDMTNGARVVSELRIESLFGAGSVRVVAVDTSIVVLSNSNVIIRARVFNTTTLAWGTLTSLGIADAGGLAGWDATTIAGTIPGVGLFTVVWGETTVKRVRVQTFDVTLLTLAGPTVVETGLPAACNPTVRSTINETCWVAYSYSSGGNEHSRIAEHNPITLVQTVAPWAWNGATSNQTATLGIERVTSTTAMVVRSIGDIGLEWAMLTNGAPGATNFAAAKDWLMMSKPFLGSTGRVYCLTIYAGQYQGTQVLVELAQSAATAPGFHAPLLPMATIAPRASLAAIQGAIVIPGNINVARNAGWSVKPGSTASATQLSTVCFAISPVGITALQIATFDFNHPALAQHVSIGDSTYMAAGTPYSFDGVRPVECGFMHAPKLSTFSVAAGGGKLWGGGGAATIIYKYVAIFSQENTQGEYQRSPPTTYAPASADTSALAATATHTATIRIQTLRATFRQDSDVANSTPVTIEVYRTHWDGAAMSTTYYRVGSFANDHTVDYIDFVDDGSNGVNETNLTTKPVLYTTGNVLESDCPPSLRFICSHNNRLFGIGDEGKTIWYTTPYVQGEQPRWNDLLRIQVPDGGGDLTALASLDGILYAFKQDRAYRIAGDGPSDTGAGADFTVPQQLPFGLGCIDARTICVIPDGIVVDTLKGLYVFGRDGSTKWIGDRTNRTRGTWIVSTITHVENDGAVRIGLRETDNDNVEGSILHWDYRVDCWSNWTISTANYSGADAAAPKSAVVVSGVYYVLFAGGAGASTFTYEDATKWFDNGSTWIQMAITSAWVATADLQGYQRVARIQVMGTRVSSHGLAIQINYNYFQAGTVFTFSSATLDAVVGREIVQVAPPTQKVASMSITMVDTPSTGTGESVQFEGLLFKVRGKRGEFKTLTSAQKG